MSDPTPSPIPCPAGNPSPHPAGDPSRCDGFLIRVGEIHLKGRNRPFFERQLGRNLRLALRGMPHDALERGRGRFLVRVPEDLPEVRERLRHVFGVTSISPVREVAADFDAMAAAAREVVAGALASRAPDEVVSFRVAARRSWKGFPLTSPEIDRRIGGLCLQAFPCLRAKMEGAAVILGIEVGRETSYLHAERIPGPGGLPVGVGGRALALFSAGIDSPVAAWLLMKRGLRVVLLHFHSWPFTGQGSKEKARSVARRLARWQPSTVLFAASIAEAQRRIAEACPERLRTVLYRRLMGRVAEAFARRQRAGALIWGDSVGQVASQTLPNLAALDTILHLPVLRPLVGQDKDETVRLARRIGTFEASIRDAPDCCTLFQPRHPATAATAEACAAAEEALDVEALVREALEGVERLDV